METSLDRKQRIPKIAMNPEITSRTNERIQPSNATPCPTKPNPTVATSITAGIATMQAVLRSNEAWVILSRSRKSNHAIRKGIIKICEAFSSVRACRTNAYSGFQNTREQIRIQPTNTDHG